MELIVPFKKNSFSKDGIHLTSDKCIFELQNDWENSFHFKYKPYYANVIEGHPLAMQRLTHYFEEDEDTGFDFGMDLIDGKIDIDTNLKIEDYLQKQTVFAIGSQLNLEDDTPILLVKNDKLSQEILLLKYIDEDGESQPIETTVNILSNNSTL